MPHNENFKCWKKKEASQLPWMAQWRYRHENSDGGIYRGLRWCDVPVSEDNNETWRKYWRQISYSSLPKILLDMALPIHIHKSEDNSLATGWNGTK